ncbi:Ctr copper transporter family protein [Venturia nashicola]|uniref:Copper transport protein n=1 Tax=Venturia nashicola TaxID=86259 RepID=A0A4Z1P389_9PEZI|nr:Ctr copper transporter family protein [Venturia nashicola]TLD35976.1 Ctr copper transporter family protein [Venturia nashicola]
MAPAPTMSSSTSNGTSSKGMFGIDMPSTFSTNTELTLFFIGWKTNTPGAYFGTLIFLFALTFFTRFLGAWRRQLDLYWTRVAQEEIQKRQNASKKLKWEQHVKRRPESQLLPLSPVPPNCCDESGSISDDEWDDEKRSDMAEDSKNSNRKSLHERDDVPRSRKGWQASNPWTLRIDGPRALLEFVRALIGYMLMLAVMTFNVGVLFAVVGGILVGELLLGRYSAGGPGGWDEGSCHGE